MTDTPLFSVLIANYNNGRFLQEAIDSVLAQTYTHWEVVIVDDASTDNSSLVYEKYKGDPRFHIFYNDKNMGCGYTKRRCADLAKGEICGFLDPDDALVKDALKKHVDVQIMNDDVSIVSSRLYFCDEKLNILSQSRLLKLAENESYLEHGDYMPECFSSFKKNLYDKTEGLSAEYKMGIDQDLNLKMEEVGKWYVLDALTYYYRSNIGISSQGGHKCFLWNNLVRIDACRRRGLDVEKLTIKDVEYYLNHVLSRMLANSSDEKWESIIKERIYDAVFEKERAIRASAAYRIGKFIIRPFQWIKNNICNYD